MKETGNLKSVAIFIAIRYPFVNDVGANVKWNIFIVLGFLVLDG